MEVLSGNLLDMAEQGKFNLIVHGCNCFHTMRSGIAKEISSRYPEAQRADFDTKYGSKDKLGDFSYATIKGRTEVDFIVVNAYTQYKWSGSKDVFEYKAFDTFLNRLCGFTLAIHENKGAPVTIGFPKIGCGLARGDESRIMSSLEKFSKDCHPWASVKLVIYSKN